MKVFLLFIIGINLFSLTKFHPYQNNFFNVLFEKKANQLFEIDYWGLSNKEALTIVAKYGYKSKVCNLGLADLYQSRKMILKKYQSNINIEGQKFNECDIILSNGFIFQTRNILKIPIAPKF